MAWMVPAAMVGGSLINSKGQQNAAKTASQGALDASNQQFDKATAYDQQMRTQLQNAITGLGANPFLAALSKLHAQKTPYSTRAFGMGGVPMSNGHGGSGPSMTGTPTSALPSIPEPGGSANLGGTGYTPPDGAPTGPFQPGQPNPLQMPGGQRSSMPGTQMPTADFGFGNGMMQGLTGPISGMVKNGMPPGGIDGLGKALIGGMAGAGGIGGLGGRAPAPSRLPGGGISGSPIAAPRMLQ